MLRSIGEQLVDGGRVRHDRHLVDRGQRQRVGALLDRPGDVVLPDVAEGRAVAVLDEQPRRLVLPQELVGGTRAAVRAQNRVRGLRDGAGRQNPGAVDVGHEPGDVVGGGVAQDLLGGADLLDAAVAHHGDAVPQAHGLVEVVGDEQDRLAELALQVDELVLHLPADERVERGEGLVHEQDVGLGGQGPGQAHALAHPSGELAGLVAAPALQAHHGQGLLGPALALGAPHSLDLQAVGGVLPHRPVRQEGEVLEDHGHALAAQLAQLRLRDVRQVLPVEGHAAGRDGQQAVDHADEGGLPGARQAHDHEDLALVDIEGGVDDGGGLP